MLGRLGEAAAAGWDVVRMLQPNNPATTATAFLFIYHFPTTARWAGLQDNPGFIENLLKAGLQLTGMIGRMECSVNGGAKVGHSAA